MSFWIIKFFLIYTGYKNVPFSRNLMCKHIIFVCLCKYYFHFLTFEDVFSKMCSYAPVSRVAFTQDKEAC
jgi:hypothetical protein